MRPSPTLALLLASLLACTAAVPLAAQRRLGTNEPCGGPIAADSLCVVTLGTGTPVPGPQASGPATAVVVGTRTFLFDAGAGVMRRVAEAGLPVDGVTAAFITHLHSDHTLGLPDLILTSWVMGRKAPMPLVGPPGLRAMTTSIMAAWAEDIRVRTTGLERGQPRGERVAVRETAGGTVYDMGGVKVTAIRVLHGSWKVALGYRVETPRRTVVIGGDARPSPLLEAAARDADVLVHEAYPAVRLKPENRPGGESWVDYMKSFHTSDAELGAIAARTRVRHLVVHHVVWMGGTPDEVLAGIRRGGYTGKVTIARDLDHF
ncbi:MAG: MBL fold metallo-hydrolase [Gemmatimonadetes bacterium]|nr:MBL fold metallo-hydrolase [Gemmatimonadota bacterium]